MNANPTPDQTVPRQAKALYKILLLAYPRDHRQAYGESMVRLFCDQYRAAWAKGRTDARVGSVSYTHLTLPTSDLV